MDTFIEVKADDGRFRTYCVMPKVTPAPVVVVIQEIFGINKDLKATCTWLAECGFIALCPDMFWRAAPGLDLNSWSEAEWKRGLELNQAYDRDRGVKDMAHVLDIGRKMPGSTGKIGIMGFCIGGLMTFLTAAREGADAAAAYYGGETDKYVNEFASLTTPMIMHLGDQDEFISPTARKAIVEAAAKNPHVQVFIYPGCMHAFARHTGTHYDKAAAALANGRTLDFFKAKLK